MMLALADPCDGWPWTRPGMARGWYYPADRAQPICIEGFDPREAPPILAKFLPFVRTDYHRWSNDTDWTLESGPDEAPSSIDIMVPYNYAPGGSGATYTNYGWEPADPPELECGQPWFCNEFGERCEVSLTEAEQARVEEWLWENPPEPDYGDDW